FLHAAIQNNTAAVIQRMRERNAWVHPFKPMTGQRQASKKRGQGCERIHRGTNVMAETREGQLFGADATTERGLPLDGQHRLAVLRKRDRRRQTIRSGADNDGIILGTQERHGSSTALHATAFTGSSLDKIRDFNKRRSEIIPEFCRSWPMPLLNARGWGRP